jgi:putative transposase
MDYISKNHSKFLIMVHLIFVCKYRKKLLMKLGEQIKLLMFDIAKEKGFEIIEIQVDQNHIHQEDNHLYLQKHFWKEQTFWSDGYFACSIGNVSKETIEKYIQSQG